MTPQEIARHHAEVELHFANGGEVESMHYTESSWSSVEHPTWNWMNQTYRKKPEKSQSEIDKEKAVIRMADVCKFIDAVDDLESLYDAGYREVGEVVCARDVYNVLFEVSDQGLDATVASMKKHFNIYPKT